MNSKIESLLSAESISGEELGIEIIKSDISKYSGNTNDVLDQNTIDKLLQKITTVEDAETLECYIQLQEFVVRSQAMANAFNQQAQNGCCRLMMYMTQSQQVEHARKMIEDLPVIMTETQYSEMPAPGPIARLRGVAIIKNEFPCRPKCLDINDYFIKPEIDCFQEMMSLETIEKLKDKIKYFREELLLDGLRKHLAYNELYRLIAERINIPDFVSFCIESDTITDQIDEMNDQRRDFEKELAGEGEEYNNKMRILNEVFLYIDASDAYPSEKNINKVRKMLEDISSFKTGLNSMYEILTGKE